MPKNSCLALSEMGWGQSATACTFGDNRTTPSDREEMNQQQSKLALMRGDIGKTA